VTTRLAAAVLVLEAFLVFFATLAATRTTTVPDSVVWAGGLGLAAVCVVAAGVVRRPHGLVVGTVVQLAIVLTGIWVPVMWVLGAVFLGVWLWMVSIGRRIDRDRAAWTEAHRTPGRDARTTDADAG
jgi:hypothetical protein